MVHQLLVGEVLSISNQLCHGPQSMCLPGRHLHCRAGEDLGCPSSAFGCCTSGRTTGLQEMDECDGSKGLGGLPAEAQRVLVNRARSQSW